MARECSFHTVCKKNAKRGNASNIKAKTHFLTLTAVPYNKVMRQGGV
jgi:hypothetical protein